MKQFIIYLFAVAIVSCNNSGKEKDQQKEIDSLNNVIKNHDDSIAKNEQEERDLEYDNKKERKAMVEKITVDKPTFTALSLGGFKDIRFNLFNDSKYLLDQVILKVHYIKANGTEVKTETQTLKDIAANSHLALTSPDYTPSGRDIRVSIETILCKQINLCYYFSSVDSVSSNDPYKCR